MNLEPLAAEREPGGPLSRGPPGLLLELLNNSPWRPAAEAQSVAEIKENKAFYTLLSLRLSGKVVF